MYPWSGYFWNGQKAVNAVFLIDYKKIFRFAKVLNKFQKSIIQLRREAPYTCQKELMEKDPFLKHLVEKSATDFVKEHGLEKMHEQMLRATVNIVCFRPPDDLNAFLRKKTILIFYMQQHQILILKNITITMKSSIRSPGKQGPSFPPKSGVLSK